MRRVFGEVSSSAGLLVVGLLLGSWLGRASTVLWLLVVAITVLALVCRIVLAVMDSNKRTAPTAST